MSVKAIHCNINLGNILICGSDVALVLLGFANASSELVVLAGFTYYAHPYCPFEKYYKSGNQRLWSDIYALAAVEAGRGRYSDSFLAAIDHGLQVDEDDRPQTVDEWREEIMSSVRD